MSDFKGHLILSGETFSGKTFLAKRIAEDLRAGIPEDELIFVLDKYSNGSDWACDFHTRDPQEFLAYCQANTKVHMFIDEGGSSLKKTDPIYEWLGTESRHNGNRLILCTQRAQQISPAIRDQCSMIFLFRISKPSAKFWAEEMNDPQLTHASNLPRYEYLFKEKFSPVVRGKWVAK